jgi:hypothetical protein
MIEKLFTDEILFVRRGKPEEQKLFNWATVTLA